MQRITITLDDDLLDQFEAIRKQRGYRNRSEAFRDLIRDRLGAEQLAVADGGDCVAILSYVYNHHQRELAARMTRLSHGHHDLTVSTLHVHLDHDNCMETVVLRGPAERVRAFAEAVVTQPGVRHGNLHLLPVKANDTAHRHGDRGPAQRHLHLEPIA